MEVFQAGQAALDYSRDNAFDAALLDIHLPDLSGLEVSRAISAPKPTETISPLIIFSGDSSLDTSPRYAPMSEPPFSSANR